MFENRKIVVGLLICILIGVISGFIIYNFSGKEVKDRLVNQMTESIEYSNNGEIIKSEVIYNGIKNNISLVFFMFVFSIMLYGTILIYFIFIIKGVSIGIYIGTLFGIFGFWWGLLVILILVILVNVVYIPAMIFIGSTFINYNLNVLEYKSDVSKVTSISKILLCVIFGLIIIFSSIIIEQLMGNCVIKISNYLHKWWMCVCLNYVINEKYWITLHKKTKSCCKIIKNVVK